MGVNNIGMCVLGSACMNDNAVPGLVKIILNARCDVNHRCGHLPEEIRVRQSETCTNADIDANLYDGCSPLVWASIRGKVAEVRALLDAGADPCSRNALNLTAL